MSASPNDLRPTLFDPVDGDEIDDLVNWQIEKGKGNWK